MPQNLPSLYKHFLKYNEDIHCQQNDKVLYGRTSTLPVYDGWINDRLETVCKDNVSGVAHYELKKEDHRYSDDNKCTMINEESTSQCQNFNEHHHDLCQDKNDFTFQSLQWLNSPEKDLLLNTARVAQASRRRQTLHRNNLCFQWLNTADNELFLNTAFAAKTSRRRHTK